VVPKGTKNKEAAMKLIAVAVSPQGMARMAETVLTNPPNMDAKPLIKPEIWEMLPAAHAESQAAVNLEYWRDNLATVSEAWNKWKVQ
jgi:putative spermidine/putrescine transport system substrate-binding protein